MTTFEPIPGYENIYEAGDDGTIWTVEGKTTFRNFHGTKQKRTWKRRKLKEKLEKRPRSSMYSKRVILWKDGHSKTFLTARLVAMAFLPNVPSKPCINHIDGNPLNDNPNNLEWCTYKENMAHAYYHDLNQHHDEVVLLNKATHEPHYFKSLDEASRFMDKNHGFLSRRINTGKTNFDKYKLFLPLKTEETHV